MRRVAINARVPHKRPFVITGDHLQQQGSRVEIWLHGILMGFLSQNWQAGEMTLDVLDEDVVIRVLDDVDETG